MRSHLALDKYRAKMLIRSDKTRYEGIRELALLELEKGNQETARQYAQDALQSLMETQLERLPCLALLQASGRAWSVLLGQVVVLDVGQGSVPWLALAEELEPQLVGRNKLTPEQLIALPWSDFLGSEVLQRCYQKEQQFLDVLREEQPLLYQEVFSLEWGARLIHDLEGDHWWLEV